MQASLCALQPLQGTGQSHSCPTPPRDPWAVTLPPGHQGLRQEPTPKALPCSGLLPPAPKGVLVLLALSVAAVLFWRRSPSHSCRQAAAPRSESLPRCPILVQGHISMIQDFQARERPLLGVQNEEDASRGTHLPCLQLQDVCSVSEAPGPSLVSLWSLLIRVPASLRLGGLSPTSLPPLSPSPITLSSHQDPLLLSHLIDGFTKASLDTRQRAC